MAQSSRTSIHNGISSRQNPATPLVGRATRLRLLPHGIRNQTLFPTPKAPPEFMITGMRLFTGWFFLWLLMPLQQVQASTSQLERAMLCLESSDLPCAKQSVSRLLTENPDDPQVRLLAARTAFSEGSYQQALEILQSMDAQPGMDGEEFQTLLDLYESTVQATADFMETCRSDICVRYSPGVDLILVDDALGVMENAREKVAPTLGGPPPGRLLLEIYPTVKKFVAASGLGEGAVRTTGVVALSKWSRLLMTSPRALYRGYPWKDTISHEYVHLVVTYQSRNQAPVWLQEGIARHLESWWRGKTQRSPNPYSQWLLAQALARDDLVGFDEMHPSMAFLPSAERAALAFAQVKVLVEFAMLHGGDQVLMDTLSSTRNGADPRDALAISAGYQDFRSFYAASLEYLSSLRLVRQKLMALPTTLTGDDEFDSDPLLAERQDLANLVRLGDLLRQAGRPRAALVEYEKAGSDNLSTLVESPLLSNRIALCHRLLDEPDRALAILRESATFYPNFALTWKSIGELEQANGNLASSIDAYEAGADINPFDSQVQSALSTLYAGMGNQRDAGRHERYLRILRTAGGLEPATE